MDPNEQRIYVCIDADDVGAKIELMLLDENIDEASLIANSVRNAMQSMRGTVAKNPTANLLMSGCDDIIAEFLTPDEVDTVIDRIRSEFFNSTGFSLTAGIGVSIRDAMDSLRRGKLMGKDQVVHSTAASNMIGDP
ncbi:mCpol domain-containing protein [Planctomycetota bacterium]